MSHGKSLDMTSGTRFPVCNSIWRSPYFQCVRQRTFPRVIELEMPNHPLRQLMAAGILSRMEGKRGIRAWRWSVRDASCPDITHYLVLWQAILHRGEFMGQP